MSAWTIEEGLENARHTFQNPAVVGPSLDEITSQVLDEGVDKFNQALDQVLAAIEPKHLPTEVFTDNQKY